MGGTVLLSHRQLRTQLRQAARSRGVEMRLHVVYGPSAVRDLLRRWGEEENVRVFGGEGMSLA